MWWTEKTDLEKGFFLFLFFPLCDDVECSNVAWHPIYVSAALRGAAFIHIEAFGLLVRGCQEGGVSVSPTQSFTGSIANLWRARLGNCEPFVEP